MEIDPKQLKEKISQLSDAELVQMLTSEKDNYQEMALTFARQEIASRGGIEDLKEKIDQLESENLLQKKELDRRVEAIREKYSFLDHVLNTLWRWKAVYGILIVAYLAYRIANQEDANILETLFSPKFLVSLLLILVLAIIYSLINGLFTYRKSLKKMALITCPQCGHYRVMNSRYLKMKLDNKGYYPSKCPKCQAPIQTDLGYLLKEKPESPEWFEPQNIDGDSEAAQNQKILSSLQVEHYKGPFKREAWRIDLTPESAVFRDRNQPEKAIEIPKENAAKTIKVYSNRTVNIELFQGEQKMKFISVDPSDLIHWME